MSKNIAIFVFLSLLSTAAMNASATSQEPIHKVVSAITIGNVATNTVTDKNPSAISVNETQYSISQDKENSENTLPATGWLLLSALLGFVLLSNRWSV